MIMYKINKPALSHQEFVIRLSDNACIPFDPSNTDYQAFKKAVLEGAQLLDADNVKMSEEDANNFVNLLP